MMEVKLLTLFLFIVLYWEAVIYTTHNGLYELSIFAFMTTSYILGVFANWEKDNEI